MINFYDHNLGLRVKNNELKKEDIDLIWNAWESMDEATRKMEFDPFCKPSEVGRNFHSTFDAFYYFCNEMMYACKFGFYKLSDIPEWVLKDLDVLWKDYAGRSLVITKGLREVFNVESAASNSLNVIKISRKE